MLRILAVDDEPMVLKLLERFLTRLGHSADAFTSGQTSIESFRANPDAYDLAMIDLTLPDIPGEDVASTLVQIKPGLPLLLTSGYPYDPAPLAARLQTRIGFIQKPFSHTDLSAGLAEFS